MEDRNNIKSKLGQKVERRLGWGIMGSVLIIILTLGIVGACAAAENQRGVTATIVIGAIALFILLASVVVYYVKKHFEGKSVEAVEPAAEPDFFVETSVAAETPVEEVSAEAEPAVAEEADEPETEAPSEAQAEAVAADEIAAEEPVAESAEDETPVVAAEDEPAEEAVPVEEEEPVVEPAVAEEIEPAVVITVEEAHAAMTDEEALALIEVRSKNKVDGAMCTVNVGILSATFEKGEVVTLDALQAKGLIPRKQNGYIVLAQGTVNKPLTVIANDFSADAVKMIVMAGGKVIGC